MISLCPKMQFMIYSWIWLSKWWMLFLHAFVLKFPCITRPMTLKWLICLKLATQLIKCLGWLFFSFGSKLNVYLSWSAHKSNLRNTKLGWNATSSLYSYDCVALYFSGRWPASAGMVSYERMNRLLVKTVLSMLLTYISSKTNAFFSLIYAPHVLSYTCSSSAWIYAPTTICKE